MKIESFTPPVEPVFKLELSLAELVYIVASIGQISPADSRDIATKSYGAPREISKSCREIDALWSALDQAVSKAGNPTCI